MLSKDGKNVLCDERGCGQEAVGGCELRIDAGFDLALRMRTPYALGLRG
jgi:hypothetical protein